MESGCSQRWECWERKPGAEDHIARIRCIGVGTRNTGFSGVLWFSKSMYKKLHAIFKMQAKVDLFLVIASNRALLKLLTQLREKFLVQRACGLLSIPDGIDCGRCPSEVCSCSNGLVSIVTLIAKSPRRCTRLHSGTV